jgi:hypothetical protein
MMKRGLRGMAAPALALVVGGCNVVLGLQPATLDDPDAASGSSTATATSATGGATCSDGMKDGAETGKDCGGGTCSPCPNGGGCVVGPDCESKVCVGGTCLPPSCIDHIKNGSESDVDCGGALGKSGCALCVNGKTCNDGTDCESSTCDGPICVDYHVWSEGFGLLTEPHISADTSGNVAVGAMFGSGTVVLGGGVGFTNQGKNDVVVAKFDAEGKHLWSHGFGDAGDQYLKGIAADGAGNVIATGFFAGTVDFGGGALVNAGQFDIFVAKFDSGGKHVWSKRFGDKDTQFSQDVAIDLEGNVLLVGQLAGTTSFGGNALVAHSNVFVAKLDPAGAHLWSHKYGDATGDHYAEHVATDSLGNVVVVGKSNSTGAIDFGGPSLPGSLEQQSFAAKLDKDGNHVWSKVFSAPSGSLGLDVTGIACDLGGNAVIVGSFGGSVDFGGGALVSAGGTDVFIAKFDAMGKLLWSKAYGDDKPQSAGAVAIDDGGRIVVLGSVAGSIDFGNGVLNTEEGSFIVRLDPSGKPLWSRVFGKSTNADISALALSGNKDMISAGSFKDPANLGGGPLVSGTDPSMFLAKFRVP